MADVLPQLASVLIVDDSTVQRDHAVSLCRQLGVGMIYEAANGSEAIDLLAMLVLPPELMIVDLEMPGMDGIELIQQMSQHKLDIPLIVVSSREQSLIHSVEAMGTNLGLRVIAGLQKPLHLNALRSALQQFDPQTGASSTKPARKELTIPIETLADAIGSGGISVHYQPKVDIRTGIVRGVEALARWRHAELGFVPPDVFIPLAEQHGLIHRLTMSVTAQALTQAAVWNGRGLRLSVAVNLSPRLLDQPSLVSDISALVEQCGLQAEQVVLEITESHVVAYLGAALGVLARLRLKGFGLSIDDYGTGFSSMQQLARIPFTELKIDRSFVHGAHQRRNLRVILQSALEMARQLGLVTVAEGIETAEDWNLLQQFGCTIGQGYLIAKPMPATELPLWLKSHRPRLHALRAADISPLSAQGVLT